jgi:hypothetical protein
MKNQLICLLLLGLCLPALRPAETNPTVSSSALTLNGTPINYELFGINSQGVLALYQGDVTSSRRWPVPFRLMVTRNGKVIGKWPFGNDHETYAQPMDEVWPFVRLGDELIVEPSRPADGEARRVIKIQKLNWYNWFNWYPKSGRGGC